MTDPVLILGGYGTFGKRIARALVKSNHKVIIAGRDRALAENLAAKLGELADIAVFDVYENLQSQLANLQPSLVVNTCGPFQGATYAIAKACIEAKVHYIDLADGREFVKGFNSLDVAAKKAGIAAITGASSVPGLSSAVVEKFAPHFSKITLMRYGINPGQKTDRGLATTRGILTYAGKKLAPYASHRAQVYGWQDLYRQHFPGIGKRWMANCEIPDLDLLPQRYGIEKIHFSAGLELSVLHLGLWALAGLVRAGLPLNLPALARPLLAASNLFNGFGTDIGAMHVYLEGLDQKANKTRRKWWIIARDGDGPQIPTIAAIILAKRLLAGDALPVGAYPCVGLISLDEYLAGLSAFNVQTIDHIKTL